MSLPCVRRARSTVALTFSRNQPYAGSTVQLRLQYALVSSDRSTRALVHEGFSSGCCARGQPATCSLCLSSYGRQHAAYSRDVLLNGCCCALTCHSPVLALDVEHLDPEAAGLHEVCDEALQRAPSSSCLMEHLRMEANQNRAWTLLWHGNP